MSSALMLKALLSLLAFVSATVANPPVSPTSNEVRGSHAMRDRERAGAEQLDHVPLGSIGARPPLIPRRLSGDSICPICPVEGSTFIATAIPELPESVLKEVGDDVGAEHWNCSKWEEYAAHNLNGLLLDSWTVYSHDYFETCLDVQDLLMRSCCDGLLPLYKCTEDVLGRILDGPYLKSVPPISEGTFIHVDMFLEIKEMTIVDYGLEGGDVGVSVMAHVSWEDERLSWNETETGCTSVRVSDNDIWMPRFSVVGKVEEIASTVIVMADGRVTWTRLKDAIAHCETLEDNQAKVCTVEYNEHNLGYDVRFSTKIGGLANIKGLLDDEYRLNEELSGVDPSRSGAHFEDEIEPLLVRLHFDPVDQRCNICGHGSATLENGTIRYYPQDWEKKYGDTLGLGCFDLDDFLSNYSVGNQKCLLGRAYFEEICCDDKASTFECESSIHDGIADNLNNISPPDPSPQENDPTFESRDFVDVRLLLDILHIFDIDIKSSTMSLLIAVELNWFDKRLKWDPFIGGCHRVSYRASIDAELTEIWVPEIELLNQVEGIQTLPESHASVRFDGSVIWRRTGVLKASCALKDVKYFPFDKTGCYMEFGGTRDPLYHRIKFKPAEPEFSERIKRPSGFQEYRMEWTETHNETTLEQMSGFSNEAIRFHFVFTRASIYYVNGFILLYVIFTYLSFGMFFVDYNMGERLAFGSSILFVVVAQDITLSESTPVSEEYLWIYKLSFGSKIFVIAGILQSLVVLYIYSHFQWKENLTKESPKKDEETRPLISEQEGTREDNEPNPPRDESVVSIDDEEVESNEIPNDDSSETNCEDDTPPGIFRNKRERCWHWFLRNDLVVKETDDMELVRMKKLKRADWGTAMFLIIAYTAFVLIMFFIILIK